MSVNVYQPRYLERVLDLPVGSLENERNLEAPETKALIKILNAFPWLVEVAENGFRPDSVATILKREMPELSASTLLRSKGDRRFSNKGRPRSRKDKPVVYHLKASEYRLACGRRPLFDSDITEDVAKVTCKLCKKTATFKEPLR